MYVEQGHYGYLCNCKYIPTYMDLPFECNIYAKLHSKTNAADFGCAIFGRFDKPWFPLARWRRPRAPTQATERPCHRKGRGAGRRGYIVQRGCSKLYD